ncbi:MAG: FtsX-like permease family protein [Chloroflexi bacterium]|nr:FtsX-like permease family protein [Chloroflexota bacterium]
MTTLRRKLIGDLRGHAGAFFAVWLTVVLGLAFYGATYPAGVAMIASIQDSYEQLHFADFTARFARADAETLLAAAQAIDGVAAAQGRLIIDGELALSGEQVIALRLIDLPAASPLEAVTVAEPAVNLVAVMNGANIGAAGDLLLLQSFAVYHDLAPGDTVRVRIAEKWHDLKLAGLAAAPEYLVAGEDGNMPFPAPNSFTVGYMNRSTLSTLVDIGEDTAAASGDARTSLTEINSLALTLTDAADPEAVRAALAAALEPFEPEFIASRAETPSGGVIDANSKGNMAIAAFFSAMFLLISAVVMAVLLARLIDGERRRVGTMRALGLTQRETLLHYLGFPLIISVTGAVVGSIIGYLGSFGVAAMFIQTLTNGALPSFVNPPQWGYILFGFGIMLLLALVAGASPALRAAQTDPGLALRPVTPAGMGAHARLTVPGLPLAAQQALRNILRAPMRSVNTLIGVVLGCTLILAASGLADSTLRVVGVQFEQGVHYDFQVLWDTPSAEPMRRAPLEAVPAVNDAALVLIGPVTAAFDGATLDTYALTLDQGTDFLTFAMLSGEPALSSGDAVWIGHNLARVLNADAGDTIRLTALGQTHEARIAGVVEQGIGSIVYLPSDLMRSWLPGGLPLVNAALVRADPAQIDAVRVALGDLPGVQSVESMARTRHDLNTYMSLYVDFSRTFVLFGFVLTLVVVFNTITVNLLERHEELMIMRTTGASLREIGAAVAWETLSITVVGILISLPLGWAALEGLLANYDLAFFGQLPAISPQSYAVAIAGIVLVILVAVLLSLRSLRRSNLGALSKTLSM